MGFIPVLEHAVVSANKMYKPQWHNRRRVVFLTLAYVAIMLPVILLIAEKSRHAELIAEGLLIIAFFTLSYYLVGPTVETVSFLKSGRSKSPRPTKQVSS